MVVTENGNRIDTDKCPPIACLNCRGCSIAAAWDRHAFDLKAAGIEQDRKLEINND